MCLWDSKERGGRPDIVQLVASIYKDWNAEVVFITSNLSGNKELMEGCKKLGIPAFVRLSHSYSCVCETTPSPLCRARSGTSELMTGFVIINWIIVTFILSCPLLLHLVITRKEMDRTLFGQYNRFENSAFRPWVTV